MRGLDIRFAKTLKMGVGYIVEHDTAAKSEQGAFAFAQMLFQLPAADHQLVTCFIEPVFGRFADLHIQAFRQRRPPDPVNQRPLAQRFNQAINNQGLSQSRRPLIHAPFQKLFVQPQRSPGFHANQFRTEFDDIMDFDPVCQYAIQ